MSTYASDAYESLSKLYDLLPDQTQALHKPIGAVVALTTKQRTALEKNKINTFYDLTKKDIKTIKNFGDSGIVEITTHMEGLGYKYTKGKFVRSD
jgi:hypothetical protein